MSDAVGYGRPPVEHRFKPGQSGNPKGGKRGRRSRRERPHVFDEILHLEEGGKKVRRTVGEQITLVARRIALEEGATSIKNALLKHYRRIQKAKKRAGPRKVTKMIMPGSYNWPDPPVNCNEVARLLNIGVLVSPRCKTARIKLYAWVVQRAIWRMSENQLSFDEQQLVINSTYKPYYVKFPDWWDPGLRPKKPTRNRTKSSA